MQTVSPFLALILNVIFPGVGLLLVPGKTKAAICWMLLAVFGIFMMIFMGLGILIFVPASLFSAWHAFFAARTHNSLVLLENVRSEQRLQDLEADVRSSPTA